MDKISSIISSSRKQVDMSKERPVRAGAPSYGQPISPATHTFQKIEKEENLMSPQTNPETSASNLSDVLRHTGMIDKITLSFKGNSEKPSQTEKEDFTPEENSSINNNHLSEESTNESEGPSLDLYA